jgi:large subunit ribosomal protein L29
MSKQAKASDLREKSEIDLLNRERDLVQQLFKLRFQQATGGAENPAKIQQVRREIARIKTVLQERKRAQSAAGSP